jgi:hypothetical protein
VQACTNISQEELIAPRVVEFYDATWNEIGTKSSLCNEIALITAIDAPILWGADIKKRSVAERMSWASSRSTTRMEDIAYCLMGIFDVYMPMLYGEGARAFLRLQQEIMSKSEDYTIFAWRSEYSNNSRQGIFATSPAAFSLYRPSSTPISVPSSFLVSNCSPIVEEKEHPALLTSRGLLVTWPLLNEDTRRDIYMAAICSTPELHDAQGNLHPACIICIALQKLPDHRPATYARAHPRQLFIRPYELSRHFQKESIYLSLSQPPADLVVLPWVRTAGLLNIQTALKFRNLPNEDPSTTCHWVGKKVFYSYKDSYSGVVANLEFSELDGDECEEFTVTVEFINNRPHCCIHTLKDKDPSTRPLCVEGHPSVDRARKVLTADDATITATIRPGPSTEETPIVHSLFIDHRPVMKPGVTTSALRLSAMDEWTQRWSESQ